MKLRNFERWLSKTYKNIYFFFWMQSLLMVKVIKNKRPGTSDLLVFRLQNKSTKISFLVIYYLTKFDGVIQSSFWVIPTITPANLCKPTHDIINYSTSICPFVSGKYGKEEEKLQKFEYLETERSFLVKIKNIFHSIWRVITR